MIVPASNHMLGLDQRAGIVRARPFVDCQLAVAEDPIPLKVRRPAAQPSYECTRRGGFDPAMNVEF